MAAEGILRANVPVDIGETAAFRIGFQLFHDIAAAVAVADGVGAAAGKAQPFDLLVRGHVWKQFFAQLLQIIPIGVRAFIDAFVIVAAGVQRDEMPFLDGALQQGQVFLVVVRRHDKKSSGHALGLQRVQHAFRSGGGAVVECQIDHLVRGRAALRVRAAGDGGLHGHDGPRVRKVLLCTAHRRAAAQQQVRAQPRRRAQAQPQHGTAPRPF